nr:DUF3052 family protein [Kofleriaceae bacterium]
MAGTTGHPLPKKLGIKAGHKVCLLNAPGHVERHILALSELGEVRIAHDLRLPPVDVVVLFVDSLADLEKRFSDIAARLHPAGGFWVAWPSARSRRPTNITEDVVRRIALVAGMVGNKVTSFRGGWAGMRLVLRPEMRDAMAYRAEPRPMRRARRTSQHSISGAGSAMHRARARSTK